MSDICHFDVVMIEYKTSNPLAYGWDERKRRLSEHQTLLARDSSARRGFTATS